MYLGLNPLPFNTLLSDSYALARQLQSIALYCTARDPREAVPDWRPDAAPVGARKRQSSRGAVPNSSSTLGPDARAASRLRMEAVAHARFREKGTPYTSGWSSACARPSAERRAGQRVVGPSQQYGDPGAP